MAPRQRDAAVTQELITIKARLRDAEDEIRELRLTVVELQSRDEESKHEREGLTFRLRKAEAHGERLEVILTTYLTSQGVSFDNIEDATTMSELVVDKKGNNLTMEEAKDLSKIYKESLANIYGVTKFSPKEHGGYPNVSNAHTSWPSRIESGRRVPLHRFNFEEDYNSPKNQPSFNAWIDNCLQHGPAMSGVLHLSSSVLNRRNLIKECAKYYSSIKRQALGYHGKQKAVVGIKRRGEGLDAEELKQDLGSEVASGSLDPINVAPVIEDQLQGDTAFNDAPFLADPTIFDNPVQVMGTANIQQMTTNEASSATGSGNVQTSAGDAKPQVIESNKGNSKVNIRSRRMTKLATREKKRHFLTGDNHKYAESKYDTYFSLGAMSDEEYVETTNEKGNKVVELVSHEYEFASDELIKCRQAIDEIQDPNESSKKLRRRRGSPRPGPPAKAKKAECGLRSWMIKADVLAKNPIWFTEGRVYPSGPEWNLNEVAPEELAAPKSKKVKLETNPNLHLVQQTHGKWLDAKQQYENWQSAQSTTNQTDGGGSDVM